ncbi:hypothetical protein [Gluconacetobacter sp.]|uniref:hypothetical protein n=1 Tax=Gluconacetobacter sp. TaxID=1935994 RepID=UPI0039EA02FF
MEAMIPAGTAAPVLMPAVLVLGGVVVILGILLTYVRQQALQERHGDLHQRVTKLEASVTSIGERFDGLDRTLEVICHDGKVNRELLTLIIRGHMPEGKDTCP